MRFKAFGKRTNGKLIKTRKGCTSFFKNIFIRPNRTSNRCKKINNLRENLDEQYND